MNPPSVCCLSPSMSQSQSWLSYTPAPITSLYLCPVDLSTPDPKSLSYMEMKPRGNAESGGISEMSVSLMYSFFFFNDFYLFERKGEAERERARQSIGAGVGAEREANSPQSREPIRAGPQDPEILT